MRQLAKRKTLLITVIALAGLLAMPMVSSANEAGGVDQVKLDVNPAWTERSDATGEVSVFKNTGGTFNSFDFSVKQLRCRGSAFSAAQLANEADRYYELVVNGTTLMKFNTSCVYSTNDDGIGGAFTSKLAIGKDALPFEVGVDSLSIEIWLQPDNVLVLSGTSD